ncbi:MAG: TraB/GumN family protein, partial [Sphingomonadaceae bacterium]|nr:TraB/GumN family protein [Sphingomonadaceae bacterium]
MIAKLIRFVPLLTTVALACSAPVAGGAKTGAAPASDGLIHATPALWAVQDADTTIYLFGTVHMLKPDVRWFEGDVKAAFDRSDTLVIEVAQGDPAKLATTFARLATNQGDPPASQALTPQQSARYAAALKTYHIPAEAMERVDPWLIAINLSVAPLLQLGYQQDLGADKLLEA